MELSIKSVISIYSSDKTKVDATEVRKSLTTFLRHFVSSIGAEIHFYDEDLLAPKGIENDYLVTKLNLLIVRDFRNYNQCYYCSKTVESYIALLSSEPWLDYTFDVSIS